MLGTARPVPAVGATHGYNEVFVPLAGEGRSAGHPLAASAAVLSDQSQYALPAPPLRQPHTRDRLCGKDRRTRYTLCGLTRSRVPKPSRTTPDTPTIWANRERTRSSTRTNVCDVGRAGTGTTAKVTHCGATCHTTVVC
jgi:hypothetical protein